MHDSWIMDTFFWLIWYFLCSYWSPSQFIKSQLQHKIPFSELRFSQMPDPLVSAEDPSFGRACEPALWQQYRRSEGHFIHSESVWDFQNKGIFTDLRWIFYNESIFCQWCTNIFGNEMPLETLYLLIVGIWLLLENDKNPICFLLFTPDNKWPHTIKGSAFYGSFLQI